MDELFTYLEAHRTGIFVGLACVAVLAGFVQWIAWIFAWGRFGQDGSPATAGGRMKGGGIRHIMADLLVKVIDDFRHLLALIVMLVFALTLGYALVTASTVEQVSGLLQAVTSAFGGIVGAIIGYYFGESAAKASSPGPDEPTVIVDGGEQAEPPAGDQAGPAGTGADGIRRAPPPPGSG